MSCSLLGKHFDIHGGGSDLQFPHHENEIAQSEGAYAKETGQPFVNVWMHNGFVRIDGEKMSKSLGNFFMIREVLRQFDAEVVRFFLLRAHYRSPVNYSDQHLEDARQGLVRLYTALAGAGVTSAVDTATSPALDLADLTGRVQNQPEAAALVQSFFAAMDDDFNTPVAVSALFELATLLNKSKDAALAAVLRQLAGALGLLGRVPTEFLQAATGSAGLGSAEIETLIAERAAAKKARDFAKADQIRADLLVQGVVLEDSAAGTTWRRQ
jgi:cysteinyl-tRNA synthetase